MSVNEGTLLDNQVQCVQCKKVRERTEVQECAICESPLCKNPTKGLVSACYSDHLEVEFIDWDTTRDAYEPDPKYIVLCGTAEGVRRTEVIVRFPHWEPNTDDEGMMINSYADEDWWLADGTRMSKEEKDEVEDYIRDDIQDRLR